MAPPPSRDDWNVIEAWKIGDTPGRRGRSRRSTIDANGKS
jgi:hypothetical protein